MDTSPRPMSGSDNTVKPKFSGLMHPIALDNLIRMVSTRAMQNPHDSSKKIGTQALQTVDIDAQLPVTPEECLRQSLLVAKADQLDQQLTDILNEALSDLLK